MSYEAIKSSQKYATKKTFNAISNLLRVPHLNIGVIYNVTM